MTLHIAGLNWMKEGPTFRKINTTESSQLLLSILSACLHLLKVQQLSLGTPWGLRYCRQLLNLQSCITADEGMCPQGMLSFQIGGQATKQCEFALTGVSQRSEKLQRFLLQKYLSCNFSFKEDGEGMGQQFSGKIIKSNS